MGNLRFGIQPFWFWNGEMDKDEMSRQIEQMYRQGIKGFMIHPRQGMEIPYLSEEFFSRVRHAVTEAKKRDMEVWIYDEFPYPSGIGGGKVVLDHPEYLCRSLRYVTAQARGKETVKLHAPWGKVLSARAYAVEGRKINWDRFLDLAPYIGTGYVQDVFQLSGLTAYNRKRYFQGELSQYLYFPVPEGEWKICIFVETVLTHFKYFDTFVDPLNPDAVRYFIETTHEAYKKHVGSEFGKTIKGFFTDEVTAFPPEQPWSPLLPDLVKKRHGIDLLEYLPTLFEDMGTMTSRIRYAYRDTAAEQFMESYDRQLLSWCHENHLLYIGEKPILRSKELEFVDIPGIDAGHQKVGSRPSIGDSKYRFNGKIVSSAAHFYHKEGALCEAFHSIGWGMTVQDMKWTFDWLAVSGINWFVIHGAYYTTDGLKKHDAPPSSFFQMPWWKNVHSLSDHAEKLDRMLQGKRTVKLLLLDPVTSTWTADEETARRLKEDFSTVQNRLLEAGLDYYIIDPQLFAAMEVVKKEGKTFLQLSGDRYQAVILPFMSNLESEAAKKLREYIQQGGRTAFFGLIPWEQIEPDERTGDLSDILGISGSQVYESYRNGKEAPAMEKESLLFTRDPGSLIAWSEAEISMPFEISSPLREDGSLVWFCTENAEKKRELFLLNLSGQTGNAAVTLKGAGTLSLTLSPYESRFLNEEDFSGKDTEYASADDTPAPMEIYLDIPMKQKILGKNALRIGRWQVENEDGQKGEAESIPVIDQLEQAGIRIPVRQKPYFGCPKELDFGSVRVTCRNEFLCNLSDQERKDIYLVMEPGTMLGKWSLWLNDHEIKEADLESREFYLNTNQAVRISNALIPGKNQITLVFETDKTFGGIRNPLYIFGDFSVEKKDGLWSLEPWRETGWIKDRVRSGIPFYAGTIIYETILEKESRELRIVDPCMQDSLTLRLNGRTLGMKAFSPYRFDVPAGLYIPGQETRLELIVDTTLSGLFEGEIFDIEKHKYEEV